MTLTTTRPAYTVRKARPWRALVILALVAACTLLAVPGTAGAHVRAKYRTEYKRQLTLFNKAFTTFANSYDNSTADSRYRAEVIAEMIRDNAPEDAIQDQADAALEIYNTLKDKPMELSMKFGKSIDAFKAKAKRYFATAKQQRLFKKRCGLLKGYAYYLMWLGQDHAYESYMYMGKYPPALDLAAKALEDADADAATGHEGWDKQRAALRGML